MTKASNAALRRSKKNCAETFEIVEICPREGLNLSQIDQTAQKVIRFRSRIDVDQMPSLLFKSSFTACGLALPPVAFIT
jgi:hypothetical protein